MNAEIVEMMLPYPHKGQRRVRVYLPPRAEWDTFPVIYMTDGQNLFDEETAFWGSWHVCEAVEAEQRNNGRAAIIVGIHNDNPWRDNELTPGTIGAVVPANDMQGFTAPEGELFDGFMLNTVIPAVEERFPVMRGRENTAVCGSSSGGLQAFYAALSHPERFCMAGVFSPAFLLYSIDDMRRWIFSRLQNGMPYLYIYTGAGDELEERIFKSVEEVYDFLQANYMPELMNEIVLTESKHNEAAWAEIFPDFLHTFLFPDEKKQAEEQEQPQSQQEEGEADEGENAC